MNPPRTRSRDGAYHTLSRRRKLDRKGEAAQTGSGAANDGGLTGRRVQRFVGSPTLVALNAGSFARKLDRQDPGKVLYEALASLREAHGPTILAPRAFEVTDWRFDPLSRGSCSSIVRGGNPDDRTILSALVGGRVLFADEAS
jgi:Flavin containing amine oxidoreductase